jgi:hypothetical protein
MANYTFNASLNLTANSGTGYSQSQSSSFTLNLTGINQIESGRADIAHDGDYGLDPSAYGASTAVTNGKAYYIKNMDDTNFLKVYDGPSSEADLVGIIEPGEFLFTIIRNTTETTTLRADTATVHVEYFFFEVDSAA